MPYLKEKVNKFPKNTEVLIVKENKEIISVMDKKSTEVFKIHKSMLIF